MIASLSLSNFKCFRSLSLECGAMNVLVGLNGAGKSTIIQSLLILRQSFESNSLFRQRIQLNGKLVELGTASEVYCSDPTNEFVGITITSHLGVSLELKALQAEEHSKEYVLQLCDLIVPGFDFESFGLFKDLFNYLHAERIGPRKVYQILPEERHPLCVGKMGENAGYVIASPLRETPISNEMLILESIDGQELPTIQYQWPLWMAQLFPGFDGETEVNSVTDLVRVGFTLQKKATGQSLFVRPGNTGFGLSYALGVIVAGLAALPNTTLIVENPEAHLHPRAQSMMGEFLARVAAGRAQVFVETHSEHVLNGIRRMLKQEVLTPDESRFMFFSKTEGSLEPTKMDIQVAANGQIVNWPLGFFDQLDSDLSVILE